MELIAHPLIERLGWTLLHSVWQGAAIALAYALASWWARGRGPELRYAISLVALAVLALAPVATFLWIGDASPAPAGGAAVATFAGATTALMMEAAHDFDPIAALEPSLPWIVALWCTGVLVSALRVWGSWRHLVALRRSAVPLGGAELAQLVARIAAELGLERPVRVARSTLVESPSVIGWFEPMILVPTAALAGLSPHQLAMILAHELAHIRRHDYLVNALQTVVETLLFFHPAVHWISGRIRQEREECCDAVAVRFGGDAIAYARALTELEELRGMRAALALAATGGVLLDRIERLLGHRPSRQRGTALASACALAVLTALTATVSAPILRDELALEPLAAEVAATAVEAPRVATAAREASAASPAEAATPDAAAPVASGALAELPIAAPVSADAVPVRGETAPAPVHEAPATATGAVGEIAALPADAAVASAATDRAASGALPAITGGERIVGAAPAYPYGARSRGIGGLITARLHVDASGLTREVEIVAADPPQVFDRAVVRALSNWRFEPMLEDGVPVAREITQQFEFEPESSACHLVTGTRICRKLDAGESRREAGVVVIRLN
jgi:TonB family protein